MKRLELTIEALSPLAIGQRKPGGSVSEALDYIPGTVIRGAIAKEMLRYSDGEPEPNDDFYQLFLDEQAAVFCNGYLAIAKHDTDDYRLSTHPVKVVPASALSNKTNAGFKAAGKSGVFDSLIDSFCAEQQGHFYTPNDTEGNLVDAFSGFYSCQGEAYYSHSISKRLLTRVGINRKRATAQDEILYSIEVMNESLGKANPIDTVYRSSILVQGSDAFATGLCDFLRSHCAHLRLGGSTSRGLGHVRLTVSKGKKESGYTTESDIKTRVEAFDKTLKDRWQLWQVLGGVAVPERSFFSLTLHADAILSEQWRRTITLSPAMLAPLLKLNESDIQAHTAYSTYSYRSGWNAAWGLPKDTELVTDKGSVMLFSVSKENQTQCYGALADLENKGVGDRCSEGYGQVRVCDEFHLKVREESV